eukprot:CAMPEP_0183378814 /NCGR_PEP_ID=MMETSP0164_2-20130417/125109_1 /TAXON_ID=221442 /ORGANISM="Coccolithus pelagicus ssp braarudi, Strain PLY182g" /LENGTH=48 /DNA_ID= /DNA_START= /DNA_END= /DNA_ORIENTATION=
MPTPPGGQASRRLRTSVVLQHASARPRRERDVQQPTDAVGSAKSADAH